MRANTNYQFTIANLRKSHSLHSQGLKISQFSLIDAKNNSGNGWRKVGKNIRYAKSSIQKQSDEKTKFYSLTFEVEFMHEEDYVCLAMNTPYSYTRLIHHMKICSQIVETRNEGVGKGSWDNIVQWQSSVAGYSISNNAVPCITIARGGEAAAHNAQMSSSKKRAIIILARQHPGETVSSFMME
jgi:hypothetical protein